MTDGEIVSRIERWRKWTAEEKAALRAEVEAEGGKVAVVARRHRISDSVLYNRRLGVVGPADDESPAIWTLPVPEHPRSGVADRVGGIGPAFVKPGKAVLYPVSGFDPWNQKY